MDLPSSSAFALLLLPFFLLVLIVGIDGRMWQENVKARVEVNNDDYRRLSSRFTTPTSTVSSPDYFRLLNRDEHSVLIGARNAIYNLSLPELKEVKKLVWNSSEDALQKCFKRSQSECDNFITMAVKTAGGHTLVCGTHSLEPLCRTYRQNEEGTMEVEKPSSDAKHLVASSPRVNTSYTSIDGELYVALFAKQSNGQLKDPVIIKNVNGTDYRTTPDMYRVNIFNAPQFVDMVPLGPHVFTFFREEETGRLPVPTEFQKPRISRVARICRSDRGGQESKWLTTYLKARLQCAIPGQTGDNLFFFDEVRAISEVFQVGGRQLLYGLFTTADNSIYGSAVCLYDFADINRAFAVSSFMASNGQEVSTVPVPEPRPGSCVDDTKSLPTQVLSFMSSHTTMSDPVVPVNNRPVVVHTSIQYRYSAIAVAPQVKAVDDQVYDILYIGTDDGKVLKAFSIGPTEEPVVVEEIDVLKSNRQAVRKLQVAGNQLLVVYNSEVHALPIERCHLARSCRECVALRDPHCAWFNNQCQFQDPTIRNAIFMKTNDVVQNVRLGQDNRCMELDSTSSFPPISNYVPEYQTSNVDTGHVYKEETLAVAVVITLLLSLVAGFVIGYQLSHYRHSSFKESSLSETSDYSYTHGPALNINRPNDYRSEPIYAPGPDYPPTKAINVVLNMQRNTLKNISTADSKPIAPSKKVYL
ncbi:hypothetical protein RvY_09830-2 [Ramazzottius varieornatus]|uniref:Sema domain-containing protein n=1 Tax=Ramazzottius varieornatus TaxID=947166 RepID=A0A1D1VAQ3_RAMVA|nr:hypothetical protein RvY_09830-2 [Ramazzottius varieornatus]